MFKGWIEVERFAYRSSEGSFCVMKRDEVSMIICIRLGCYTDLYFREVLFHNTLPSPPLVRSDSAGLRQTPVELWRTLPDSDRLRWNSGGVRWDSGGVQWQARGGWVLCLIRAEVQSRTKVRT